MSSVNFLPTISLYKAVEICVTGSSVGRVISTNYSSCCGWSSGINMFIGSKTNSNSWFIENCFVIFDILLSLTGFTKFFSNDWSVCLLQLIFFKYFCVMTLTNPAMKYFYVRTLTNPATFSEHVFPTSISMFFMTYSFHPSFHPSEVDK